MKYSAQASTLLAVSFILLMQYNATKTPVIKFSLFPKWVAIHWEIQLQSIEKSSSTPPKLSPLQPSDLLSASPPTFFWNSLQKIMNNIFPHSRSDLLSIVQLYLHPPHHLVHWAPLYFLLPKRMLAHLMLDPTQENTDCVFHLSWWTLDVANKWKLKMLEVLLAEVHVQTSHCVHMVFLIM